MRNSSFGWFLERVPLMHGMVCAEKIVLCAARTRYSNVRLALGVVFLLVFASVPIANAQADDSKTDKMQPPPRAGLSKNYKTLPIDAALRSSRSKVSGMLRRGIDPSGQAMFDDYFVKYFFPQWTDPKNFPNLPSLRKELHNNLLSTKGNPAHKRLNDLVLTHLGAITKSSDFHPAVRFNALLAIGDLVVTPPEMGQIARPLPESRPIMFEILKDPKIPDPVRVGALLGLLRHAKLGIEDEEFQAELAKLSVMATSDEAFYGRSKAGQDWVRIRAIEILGSLSAESLQPQIAQALASIVSNSETPLPVRAEAARTLGNKKWSPESGLIATVLGKSLGSLALTACEAQLDACKADPHRPIDPRTLKTYLLAAHDGLAVGSENGLGAWGLAEEDKDKEYLKSLDNPISKWLKLLDNKDLMPSEESPRGGPPPGVFRRPPQMGSPDGSQPRRPPENPALKASRQVIQVLRDELQQYRKLLDQAG